MILWAYFLWHFSCSHKEIVNSSDWPICLYRRWRRGNQGCSQLQTLDRKARPDCRLDVWMRLAGLQLMMQYPPCVDFGKENTQCENAVRPMK